jgi:hypothetical protein
MVTATAAVQPKLEIGHVTNATFGVVSRNLLTLVVLASMGAVPQLLMELVLLRVPPMATLFSLHGFAATTADFLYAQAQATLYSAITTLVNAAFAQAVIADLNGRRAPFGECLRAAFSDLFSLFGLAITSHIAVTLGSFALAVPGILLSLAWAVIVPVRVVERTGFRQTFERSAELTRNNRLAIFGLGVIYTVALGVLIFSLLGVLGFGLTGIVQAVKSPAYLIGTSIVGIFAGIVFGTGTAVIYYELRAAKEGIGPQELAAVFD